ncbi:MAG: response regulator [Longimicrobiales bacterium]|nr:response regulator [Longimicrobiales bacterium]
MAESRRRVLVVEDDEGVRQLVARHLEQKGYEVAHASDAEQVLLRMSRDREPFDLVLSDIHLPGLSGVELLRLLLTHSPLRPVIMITGDADESLARRALDHGAAGYLLKPFELFELDAAVMQALSRLELVEAAEAMARSEAADGRETGGAIPKAWLELADTRSAGGPGHGHRVARLAAAIVSGMDDPLPAEDRTAVDVAARSHELGRLLGPTVSATELASRTAQLLYDLGVESRVLRTVNHLRERWNGSGGPNGISGEDIPLTSRVVAAADAIDHAAVARLESGRDPADAVAAAIHEVAAEAEQRYGPAVARAVRTASSVMEAIWVLTRGPATQQPEPEAVASA